MEYFDAKRNAYENFHLEESEDLNLARGLRGECGEIHTCYHSLCIFAEFVKFIME